MMRTKQNSKSPLKMPGGKKWLRRIICPIFPFHLRYVEPFVGAGHIFFFKDPAPHEILSDRNPDLINFYRVVQHTKKAPRLFHLLWLTPFSLEEFLWCKNHVGLLGDEVLRAWAWYVAGRQARFGLGGDRWGRIVNQSSRGMISSTAEWLGAIARIHDAHDRLQGVQIENRDFRSIIREFDSPDTLFFLDPPYLLRARGGFRYSHDLTESDHVDLADILLNLKGMAVLLGYANSLYAILEGSGWTRLTVLRPCYCDYPSQRHRGRFPRKRLRKECLWISPSLGRTLPIEVLNLNLNKKKGKKRWN